MMKFLNSISVVMISMMLLFAGCSQSGDNNAATENDGDAMSTTDGTMEQNGNMDDGAMQDYSMAIATINPTEGNDAEGTVTFEGGDSGVNVKAEFSGLPEGKHGFHIHLYGDCSAADGTSAGTHFNFEGSSENPPADIKRITGNLGNVTVGSDGTATADTTISNTTLNDIMGRAVIVHEKQNDSSQPPIGAAGARLGCGVIGIANPESMMSNDSM